MCWYVLVCVGQETMEKYGNIAFIDLYHLYLICACLHWLHCFVTLQGFKASQSLLSSLRSCWLKRQVRRFATSQKPSAEKKGGT